MTIYFVVFFEDHFFIMIRAMEGRKEGTCLFDINNHNTEYTSVKILSIVILYTDIGITVRVAWQIYADN